MALEDLARFLAPKSPKRAMSILQCFYNNEDGCTLADMMRATGLREKALRYHITKFKRWKLLWTQRHYMRPATYHLEQRAFHIRLDTVLVDPLQYLKSPQPWQSGERAEAASA